MNHEATSVLERDHQAEVDLYKTLARLEHMTDGASAHKAAAALRDACVQGRLYGLSYGYMEDRGPAAGQYIACALGHLVHAADPESYARDDQGALAYLVNYPHTGETIEHYCMYVPRGATPEDNQYLANISNWLDNYLSN